MDSFIVFPCSKLLEFRRFIAKERKKESLDLTVDDSIDVDSVDDIGFEKLLWNLASLPEVAATRGRMGKMAAQERL